MSYTIDGDLYRTERPLTDLDWTADPVRSPRRRVDRGRPASDTMEATP